jgi:hypothetical protein
MNITRYITHTHTTFQQTDTHTHTLDGMDTNFYLREAPFPHVECVCTSDDDGTVVCVCSNNKKKKTGREKVNKRESSG